MPAGRWEMKKRRSGETDVAVERGSPVTGVRGRTGMEAAAGIEATGQGKGKGKGVAASASGASRNLKEGIHVF